MLIFHNMKPILEVQSVSKKFRISHMAGGYLSLREKITGLLTPGGNSYEDFWALKDVSFQVQKGEAIGIIGKNGAGKSTLLKILSKITPPTEGRIISRGRIASLLEVGTGLHPELTGRENIFFYGALLGMKSAEIEIRFDEIVDFSGTERFLDTPLKHYSSGMQLRLAFSVAAFLEPEILIIDEVLAVGDTEFQKKCLGKMENVSKSGRTILFVSHQLGVVSQLCRRAILLNEGKIAGMGDTLDIINKYNASFQQSMGFVRSHQKKTDIFFQSIQLADRSGISRYNFLHNEEMILDISVFSEKYHSMVFLSVAIQNSLGRKVFTTERPLEQFYNPGEIKLRVELPRQFLAPGSYSVYAAIHVPRTNTFDELDRICDFTISDGGSEFAKYEGAWFYGDVFADCKWESYH